MSGSFKHFVRRVIGQQNVDELRACACMGPQDGEPVCPCMMRHVTVVDGRYVQIIDLGPQPIRKYDV